MNEEDLKMLAQQVVEKLRPRITAKPIQLNKNFPNNFKIYLSFRKIVNRLAQILL